MSYKIIGKYIKNLDFSIPNPKTFFLLSKNISNYKINIDIKSIQVKEKIIEVQTTLSLLPIKDNFEKINTKIVYSTIIEITNDTNNNIECDTTNISDDEEQAKTETVANTKEDNQKPVSLRRSARIRAMNGNI